MAVVIRILAALLLLCASANADVVLVSDNFDDGNISEYGGGLCVSSNEDAYGGTGYAAKCTHSGTVALIRSLDTSIMQYYAAYPVRISYRFKIASSWPVDGVSCYEAGLKFARLRHSSQDIQSELYWDSGVACTQNEPLTIRAVTYHDAEDGTGCTLTTGGTYGSTQSFNRDTWMLVEIEYKLNTIGASDGYLTVRFDGVTKINRQNIIMRCSASSVYNQFYVPSNIGDASTAAISYTDNLEIRVLDATGPTPTPTPAPTPTPSPTPDVIAPTLSSATPTTAQACTADPRSILMGVSSNENATCRYGLNGTAWAAMTQMSSTGGTTHAQNLSLACAASYQYDIICQDPAGNQSAAASADFSISAATTPTPTATPAPPENLQITRYGGTLYH